MTTTTTTTPTEIDDAKLIEASKKVLRYLERKAREALSENDMEKHMKFGRDYHELADLVLEITGVELRPSADADVGEWLNDGGLVLPND